MSEKKYIESPSQDLTIGAAALLFGSWTFCIIGMIVVMTPDPEHQINYTLFWIVEAILFSIAVYGVNKLNNLVKFLQMCERTTEVWESKKNLQEEQTSQSGPNSMQKPRLEK